MTTDGTLIDGRIPAGSPCPYADECGMRMERCPTRETPRSEPFSCALARLHEMIAARRTKRQP